MAAIFRIHWPTYFRNRWLNSPEYATTNYNNPIWSGYLDRNTTGYKFTDVHATFNAAAINPSYSAVGSHYSSWVGFGGFSITGGYQSNGLLQAGVDCSLFGNGSTTVSPFWEAVPYNNEQYINNFPINQGDEIYVDISYSATNGTFSWYIEDETKGTATSSSVNGMSSLYDGTEAEAITEANQYSGQVDCGDFGSVNMGDMGTNATNNSHYSMLDPSNPYSIWKIAAQSTDVLIAPSSPTGTNSYVNYWHNAH